MLVSDSAVRPLGPFVEPVVPEPWYRAVLRWVLRQPPPVYTQDATSYPGGVAVLFAGHTVGAGRMIDLYSERGTYEQTLILPARSLRIAGNGERVYALRESGDSILLASYILPWRIRSAIRRAQAQRVRVTDPDGAARRAPPLSTRDNVLSRRTPR